MIDFLFQKLLQGYISSQKGFCVTLASPVSQGPVTTATSGLNVGPTRGVSGGQTQPLLYLTIKRLSQYGFCLLCIS